MTTTQWLALGLGVWLAQASLAEPAELKSGKDMISYGIGMYMAKSFKKDDIDVDQKLVLMGLRDGMAGKSLLPDKTLRKAMNEFQGETRRKAAARYQAAALENQQKSSAFLADNKAREGVVTLASGLGYRVLKPGDGRKPTISDSVDCLYRGTLLDGTEFDGTDPGKPATLKVSQLIPGWREALQLMPTGAHWQIFVPPQLAYGARGAGSDIGPNETLVFDVELVAIK